MIMNYSLRHAGYESNEDSNQIVKAEGAYLYTKRGQRLLDLCMAAGSQLLGHSNPEIVSAIQSQVSKGTIYLSNNQYIHETCELLSQVVPSEYSDYIFSNSGTEATQKAIRISRLASGKSLIASFEGGWHGSNEWTLHDSGSRFDLDKQALNFGIPASINRDRLIVPYNCDKTFETLERHKEKLAAIIIEPIQGSNPQKNISGFLKKLTAFCSQHNILIIADEIISGFRVSLSGASPKLGLKPDIITYGKSFAGGLPVGLTVINEKVSQMSFGNPENAVITGGTYSANPLMAVAATATLKQLIQKNYTSFNTESDTFKNTINSELLSKNLPFNIISNGPFLRLAFTDKPFKSRAERDKLEMPATLQKTFKDIIKKKEIFWPTNGIILPSFEHKEPELRLAREAIISSCIETCEFL
ncbi:aminotransferase class III-fold pyridoxal phosphate-dependent enzyme [Pseudoalteromonas gelatinilytica]|uniref:Aminotransferase class III-fold pyridoxal phosphate-dependent enzyme n=2 Tax=Pseudoalteromonas gelatinilytica TaxID=1703256 RepID=A0A3A3EH20_9GAMM|nr:aminotransferase class III-fold pyridoxal phosphate-dependent enzyme [Pseudoalteromonas profundi]